MGRSSLGSRPRTSRSLFDLGDARHLRVCCTSCHLVPKPPFRTFARIVPPMRSRSVRGLPPTPCRETRPPIVVTGARSAIAVARCSAEEAGRREHCVHAAVGASDCLSQEPGRSLMITGRPSAKASMGFCGVTVRDTARSNRGTVTTSSDSTHRPRLGDGHPARQVHSLLDAKLRASSASPGAATPSPTSTTWSRSRRSGAELGP